MVLFTLTKVFNMPYIQAAELLPIMEESTDTNTFADTILRDLNLQQSLAGWDDEEYDDDEYDFDDNDSTDDQDDDDSDWDEDDWDEDDEEW